MIIFLNKFLDSSIRSLVNNTSGCSERKKDVLFCLAQQSKNQMESIYKPSKKSSFICTFHTAE